MCSARGSPSRLSLSRSLGVTSSRRSGGWRHSRSMCSRRRRLIIIRNISRMRIRIRRRSRIRRSRGIRSRIIRITRRRRSRVRRCIRRAIRTSSS